MLATMSEFDPRADVPVVNWGELGVSGLLPTGTVTLLLADVEGSTRLWETRPRPDDRRDRAAKRDRVRCHLTSRVQLVQEAARHS
jgi:class 3 adenylate cyclase